MTYFTNFPSGLLKIGNEYKYVTDIFRRVYTNTFATHYSELETVTIPEGYTVEQVSDLYYGSPTYHWVIMILNNIVDIREEWPRSNTDLVEYALKSTIRFYTQRERDHEADSHFLKTLRVYNKLMPFEKSDFLKEGKIMNEF
jgi:hypothetical protein